MINMTKAQKRQMRELAGMAYERELGAALEGLHKHFERWQAGEITPWDLDELIHEHHNGISRELYRLYEDGDPAIAVARAIAKGLVSWDEVREDCRPMLGMLVGMFGDEGG